jgi:Uma2 family endonuclease
VKLVLPEEALPATLSLNPELRMSDEDYFDSCAANPEVRFERTAGGEILIVPPAGYESDYECVDVITQLRIWAKRDGRGKVSGTSTEFILPTGAAFSPAAAWVSNARLATRSKQELRKFLHLSPEFVIEVMSPSDRLKAAQEKMQEWLRGGVELGWLIHPDEKTVYIYRAGHSEPEKRENIAAVEGEGPVAGFNLDLVEILAGL